MTNLMHDEDNKYGLRVSSEMSRRENPDHWIAYGDNMLHHPKNGKNLQFVRRAVQEAVDDVFKATESGWEQTKNESDVFKFIPEVDPDRSNSPMFQVKNGNVVRRKKINDLQCEEYISDWISVRALWSSTRTNPVVHSQDEE